MSLPTSALTVLKFVSKRKKRVLSHTEKLTLMGDIVATVASPGHDIELLL
jgi:hypothetical protein